MSWVAEPSGLLIGAGPRGPVAVRLFRPQGTRVLLGAPEYVSWLLAYRAGALGAHITVIGEPRAWQGLIQRLRQSGASVEVGNQAPDEGLPYRPSLVLGDMPGPVGRWQAHLGILEPNEALARLRSADLAVVTPDEDMTDQLRRAFLLTGGQTRAAAALTENQVALVSAHRLVRVGVRPAPTEYRALFG